MIGFVVWKKEGSSGCGRNQVQKGVVMKDSVRGIVALIAGALLLAACGQKQISFKADVQPIIKQYCLECHGSGGQGTLASGLDMTTYESLMKGTRYGSIVKPGDSLSSVLNMLVEGRANPAIKMPHGKEPLPQEQAAALRTWVDQRAKNN